AGSHVLDQLASDAPASSVSGRIVAWHRPRATAAVLRHRETVEWQAIDILDREAVRSAIAKIRPSIVYHCSGAAHVGRAWDHVESTFATNVRGTHHVLDALSRAGAEARVLIPSSALVYTPADRPLTENDALVPSSPYGVSKLAQERLAAHAGAGLVVTVARAF